MRDRLEADKRPRCKRDDGENLQGGRLAVRERGGEASHPDLVLHHDRRDACRDAEDEDEREERLDAHGKALAAEEHAAHK